MIEWRFCSLILAALTIIKSCIGEDSAESDARISFFTVAAAPATDEVGGGVGVAGALAASDAWELLLILSAAIAADAVFSVNAAMMTVLLATNVD